MQVSPEQIAAHVEGRSPAQIAAGVSRMVTDEVIRPGDRLPVVHDLARELGVSAGTVGAAWRTLADLGLVEARGRAGTFVLATPTDWLPPRYRRTPPAEGIHLDLSTGTPDPALLPDVRGALEHVAGHLDVAGVSSYLAPPVLPELGDLMAASWPFRAQRITVVSGAMDGLIRTLNQVVRFGDRVAVESPGYPPVFDVLDQLGLVKFPLELDRRGVTVESVEAALAAGARAFVIQPRAQNPTGVSMSATRARDVASAIRGATAPGKRPVIVIEDDHSGEIVQAPDLSLGVHLPDRVVHIRSYSKSHGPDLRLAALGGPAWIVDAVVARRLMGTGWTSRMLQAVLADLLSDPAAQSSVRRAALAYAQRRQALADALAAAGVRVNPGDGLTMWVPVHREEAALARLTAAGVRVSGGSQFQAFPDARPGPGFVRVTVGALSGDAIDSVAGLLAAAARA